MLVRFEHGSRARAKDTGTWELKQMNVTEFQSGGTLLSAKSVKDRMHEGKEFTIEDVTSQEFDDNKKLIVSFVEIDESLALNQTNLSIMADAFGKETNDWKGKKISLSIIKTKFGGNMVDGIQVKPIK